MKLRDEVNWWVKLGNGAPSVNHLLHNTNFATLGNLLARALRWNFHPNYPPATLYEAYRFIFFRASIFSTEQAVDFPSLPLSSSSRLDSLASGFPSPPLPSRWLSLSLPRLARPRPTCPRARATTRATSPKRVLDLGSMSSPADACSASQACGPLWARARPWFKGQSFTTIDRSAIVSSLPIAHMFRRNRLAFGSVRHGERERVKWHVINPLNNFFRSYVRPTKWLSGFSQVTIYNSHSSWHLF
jgi:hypothetical protein